MKFVQCPEFIRRDGDVVVEIKCKVCGTVIAGMTERISDTRLGRNGEVIQTKTLKFTRYPNYAELKMALGPGQFHVTHGCYKCLVPGLTPEQLNELMEADMEEQSDLDKEYSIEMRARVPTSTVAIKVGGGL